MDTPKALQGVDIVLAFKDENYRATLTEEQRSLLLQVAVSGELSEDELDEVSGGLANTERCVTYGCTTEKCGSAAAKLANRASYLK